MSKYPLSSAAIDAFLEAIRRDDDAAVEAAFQRVTQAQQEEMSQGVSDPEGVMLQFRAAAGCIENHLRKGDLLSAAAYFRQLSEEYEDMCDRSPLSAKDILPIKRLLRETLVHIRRAVAAKREERQADQPAKTERPIGKCALCGENEADCTGSHLAPHFLIQPFLSYNGSSGRDTEVVNETALAGFRKERKWGRAVPGEAIDETFGAVPEEEKELIKDPSLTRDYVLCKDCEKRFGFVETAYAESFRKQRPCANGLLAYLFWLGVFWRLSVGKMALRLDARDENRIRVLLQRMMPADANALKHLQLPDAPAPYGYRVYHCADTKGELSGVIGTHAGRSPYQLLVGKFIIELYSKRSDVGTSDPVNMPNLPEQWQEIPFIDYWKKKQKILNINEAYESKRLHDGREKIVDVVKGDHVEELPTTLFGLFPQELGYDDLDGRTLYSLKYPASLQKVMLLTEQHPEADTAESRLALIEKELGYTKDELQEMAQYWLDHARILKLPGRAPVKRKKKRRRKKC